MVEIIIGIIAGIISGLGMGGGTILTLLLLFFLNIDQHIAQGSNIIFFIPTAISAIIINLKNKNIDLKLGIVVCLWGIIGAFIGSKISIKMDVYALKKYFGFFLILIAIYQTYEYIKDKKRHNNIKSKKGG